MRSVQNKISDFASTVMGLLENIEYRRIENADDLEDVARIRYKAFTMVGLSPPNGELLIDELDYKPNAHIMGIFFDEQLVTTIRLHHVTADQRDSVAVSHFPDVMHPLLDAGHTFIDPARFAGDPDLMREYPALPYLTLRLATMATIYYQTDFCLSVIKPNHCAFYRRVFKSRLLAEPRYFERYNSTIELLGASRVSLEQPLLKRFPFFESKPFERRLLFAERQDFSMPILTVRPTAKYVVQQMQLS